MVDNKFVIAITGPTGSGKSTIAEKIANKLDKCVNIEADHIKHMIVSGFYEDDKNAGGWGFNQWELVGDSIGLLTSNFLKKGYSVIVNGYIDETAWTNIQKHVDLTYKLLLLPPVETVKVRDNSREESKRMGEKAVIQHYEYFSNDELFKNFIILDTTNQTADETVAEILRKID